MNGSISKYTVKLAEKDLHSAVCAYAHAKSKPNVREEELDNLMRRIASREEILLVLKGGKV